MSLTVLLPSIVTVLYFITACAHFYKREWALGWVWFSYASTNIGMIIVGISK